MKTKSRERLERIVRLIGEKGFLSVPDLSKILQISEITVRRDLDRLAGNGQLQRTYGGAAVLPPGAAALPPGAGALPPAAILTEQGKPEPGIPEPAREQYRGCSEVLVAASLNPRHAQIIQESGYRKNLPMVAESFALQNTATCVSLADEKAGLALGGWAAAYVQEKWSGKACVLDLTYHLPNTQKRSEGFLAGLRAGLAEEPEVLSLNPQTLYEMAYQLTLDALAVKPQTNLIFAVNDTIAWGAINACRALGRDPESTLVVHFGLEGDRLKDELASGGFCKASLAMFPEVVGPACVEASIVAYNHLPLPEQVETPYAILTRETLATYYVQTGGGWVLRWETIREKLGESFDYEKARAHPGVKLPSCIGVLLPFSEHDWYKNMLAAMQAYARQLAIEVESLDFEQTLKDEVESRRREIARCAAEEIKEGEAVMLDGGLLTQYLAERLRERNGITVITNSLPVTEILNNSAGITLILTGGVLRRSSQALVGPTAENSVRELRADKLFLTVTGISQSFGLSHTVVAEVTMKKAMIQSAREVILLADYTCFGEESVVQIAPLQAVQKIITDDALAASRRLTLTQMGIQVIIART